MRLVPSTGVSYVTKYVSKGAGFPALAEGVRVITVSRGYWGGKRKGSAEWFPGKSDATPPRPPWRLEVLPLAERVAGCGSRSELRIESDWGFKRRMELDVDPEALLLWLSVFGEETEEGHFVLYRDDLREFEVFLEGKVGECGFSYDWPEDPRTPGG